MLQLDITYDIKTDIKFTHRGKDMKTREDILKEIESMPKDEQIKYLQSQYSSLHQNDELNESLIYCEILAFDFNDMFYKSVVLPSLYDSLKMYDKSVNIFESLTNNEEALKFFIDTPSILFWFGIAHRKMGYYDLAKTILLNCVKASKDLIVRFPQAQDIHSKNVTLAFAEAEIGKIHYEQGEFNSALSKFDESMRIVENIDAMYYISHMIYKGQGIEKDVKSALNGFSRIADNDLSSDGSDEYIIKANYEMGIIYANESGFKDKNKSVLRLQRAKSLGYEITVEEIDEITKDIVNDEKPSQTNNEKKSGGCYIATCVYGSYDCPPVWTLRRFRDEILSNTFVGRLFVKFYYATSPTLVKMFGKYSWFHKIWKPFLDILVERLGNKGVEDTPYND